MVVPEEIVVDVRNKAFVERRLITRRMIFIVIELELNLAKMGFGYSSGSKKTPSNSKEILSTILILIISIE